MNPVKLKLFSSTFLLIFFYFPKNIDGLRDTCDGNHCETMERHPSERHNRMVNVRDRVGTERLVNNRRIVDSDSRISENLASRSFDFPRLVERTCEASRQITSPNRETRLDSRDIRTRENRNVHDSRAEDRSTREVANRVRLSRNEPNTRVLDREIGRRNTATENRVETRSQVRDLDRDTRHVVSERRSARTQSKTSRVRISTRVENRITRTTDRSAVDNNERRITHRMPQDASESRNVREMSTSFRNNNKEDQRTNKNNIRIMEREVRRNVDINNNRRVERSADRNDRIGRVRDQSRMVASRQTIEGHFTDYLKNDISRWSHVLTTTFGVLLFVQIIASSTSKKYRLSHISNFLQGVKQKVC